jgi:predicted amidophosphoribosyltransferase
LADAIGWKYAPELIQKLWPTQKASNLITIDQRKDEFRNNYGFNESFGYIENTPVLVIDDIVTTGTTMAAILNSLDEVCSPENLITFSLALTCYNPALNASLNPHADLYSFNDNTGWFKKSV